MTVDSPRSSIYSTASDSSNNQRVNASFSRNLYLPGNRSAGAPQFPGGRDLTAWQSVGMEAGSELLQKSPFVKRSSTPGDFALTDAAAAAARRTRFAILTSKTFSDSRV